MKSLEAIQKAIRHYESEYKNGKEYANPILFGLQRAYQELSMYQELRNKYFN